MEIFCRRRGVGGFSEEFPSACWEADLNMAERVEILVVEGSRTLRLDCLESLFLGEAPQLFGVGPVDDGLDHLFPAFSGKGVAGSHLIRRDYKL